MRQRWLAFLLAQALWACGEPDTPASYPVQSSDPGQLVALSQRVVVVADSQFQHLDGGGFDMRTALADRIASSALRPVQLDMFSGSLLAEACRRTKGPVLHLGDGANTSCKSEIETLAEIMNACRKPDEWLMTPGNHDGFFIGTSARECDAAAWARACGGQDRILDKADFVDWYAAEGLPRRFQVEPESVMEGVTCLRAKQGQLLERACWHHADAAEHFKSFVVQQVAIGEGAARVHAILLDTSQYEESPKLIPRSRDAGSYGAVLGNQWAVVRKFLQDGGQDLFILMGHHPYNALLEATRDELDDILDENRSVLNLYVSAHTHHGALRKFESGQQELLELNVGSITDFPSEYRDFMLFQRDTRLFVHTVRNPERRRPPCQDEWFTPSAEYVAYRAVGGLTPEVMRLALLKVRAKTWLRFLMYVGLLDEKRTTDLKNELARALKSNSQAALVQAITRTQELERKERTTPPPNDQAAQKLQKRDWYRQCIAYEAARYEGCPYGRRSGCRSGPTEVGRDALTFDEHVLEVPAHMQNGE